MMFFSTASWKSGGGGRSSARKRNGEELVLISVAHDRISVIAIGF
jgi:hypothetical protein